MNDMSQMQQIIVNIYERNVYKTISCKILPENAGLYISNSQYINDTQLSAMWFVKYVIVIKGIQHSS